MKLKEIITESGLSRIHRSLQEHDAGILTAFRGKSGCGNEEDERYSRQDNMKRNLSLRSKISHAGYGYTTVQGSYIENYGSENEAMPQNETSFIVVDIKDTGNLRKHLMEWGNEFMQDSVLFLPRGARSGMLISTNTCADAFPGFGKMGVTKSYKNPIFGKGGEFMTKVGGRPFIMSESTVGQFAIPSSSNLRTKAAMSTLSKKHWTEMPDFEELIF